MRYVFLLLALGACARGAADIQPAQLPADTFASLDCEQINKEHNRLLNRVDDVSRIQNQTARRDKIGVIFLGLPIGSLGRRDREVELSLLKGQEAALRARHAERACTEPLKTEPPL